MPDVFTGAGVMTTPRTSHPAKFPQYILARIALYVRAESRRLGRPVRVLDPFAGVGRIHNLPKRYAETVGVELEAEWAACRSRTIVGNATKLPRKWTETFDVVATSPCYGNRLADHHDAKDACGECGGIGVVIDPEGCADAPWLCPSCSRVDCSCGGFEEVIRRHNASCSNCRKRLCPRCGGAAVSKRYTYKHSLRRDPSEGSAAVLNWTEQGGMYRGLHRAAWKEAHRVLMPKGLILVNMKNHLRNHVEQKVTEWHVECLTDEGFDVETVIDIPAPGIRHGANRVERVDHERLIVGRRR